MTTAHRPTFDPARGKDALRGPAYHQRLLPAHTQLKYRQPGQGGDADSQSDIRDLASELLAAETAHYAKKNGQALPSADGEDEDGHSVTSAANPNKRPLALGQVDGNGEGEDGETMEAKRRRILAETRDIDADSDSGGDSDSDADSNSGSDSDDDSEDEQAELMRELERVKREKALKREKEEAERRTAEEDQRVRDIALGNPLLNPKKPQDFQMKRRWDDDVVFKNQARGADDRGQKKEFVNDLLRSDFHKRFMSKYVR